MRQKLPNGSQIKLVGSDKIDSIVGTNPIGIIYDGVDIAADLAPYLLGVTYTDNLSGAADDLQIALQDRDVTAGHAGLLDGERVEVAE
jgi:phage protein D